MKRLYWENTYLMNHNSIITSIGQDDHGHYIRLNETIFHPQGGGQPSDEGTINGFKVTKLRDLREINEINHYVEDVATFKVGATVALAIDADKRLEYAALHTAGHITGAVLRTEFHYKDQLGANHFPKQSKVEFNLLNNVSKLSLEEKVNLLIAESKKVTQIYNDDGMRCIAIEGLWTEPCSGTHVNDTSEITNYEIRKIEAKKDRLTVGYNAAYHNKS